MAIHNEFGKEGEKIAADYLQEKGYEIIERNWRKDKLELDIVADYQGFKVFVEVKSRSTDFDVEELIPRSKEISLLKAVNVYLEELEDEVESRIDLIILNKSQGKIEIEHLENAIDPW